MESSSVSSKRNEEDATQFDKSLKELRELRTDLHNAAQYCESTFFDHKDNKLAVEKTKEYVCRAVVAVVDHLGCVCHNLNAIISETNHFSEASLRIHTLKQRIAFSEEYGHKLALHRLRFRDILPRHQPRFLASPIKEDVTADQIARDSKIQVFKREDNMPLFVYTYPQKPALLKRDNASSSLLLPVRDALSTLSKPSNPAFQFQAARKAPRSRRFRGRSDIFSFIRRSTKSAT